MVPLTDGNPLNVAHSRIQSTSSLNYFMIFHIKLYFVNIILKYWISGWSILDVLRVSEAKIYWVWTMVSMQDGRSEHFVHAWCKNRYEKIEFDHSFDVTKCLHLIEIPNWLHLCAEQNEQPSNIETMSMNDFYFLIFLP